MKSPAASAERGRQAEAATARYLLANGFEICEQNFKVHRVGELDLIVRHKGQIYIVEVKARSGSDEYGGLAQAITRTKLNRMRRTAWCYLKEKGLMNCDVSFLAALAQIDSAGKIGKLTISPIEWL